MKFSMINSARIVLFTAYFLLVCISPITSVDARAAFPKLYLTQQEFEQSIKSLRLALHQHILQKKKLFLSLIAQLLKEPESWAILVDKGNKISPSYGPTKFVDLSAYGWAHVTRAGLQVSTEILPDLEKMIRAATKDDITLTIGRAYRSYAYQQQVHRRLIQQLGEKAAQRLSSPRRRQSASIRYSGGFLSYQSKFHRYTSTAVAGKAYLSIWLFPLLSQGA